MAIKTFRFRLAIFWTGAAILLIFILSSIILVQHKRGMIKAVDNKLIQEIKNILPEFEKSRAIKNAELVRKRGDEYYQIINKENSFIISALNGTSHGLPFNRLLLSNAFNGRAEFETIRHNNENYRVLYFPADRENVIRLSYSLFSKDEDFKRLQRLFINLLPFLFLISAGVGWLIAGMALSPVNKIKSAAEHVINGNSDERINLSLKGEEYSSLISLFNKIFDKNQGLTETQRLFASNVSHEIRSPLTSLRGNIEVALRKKRNPQEYEEVLRNSLFDVIRLSKMTDNLLFLAKADNNLLQLRKQRIDISYLLSALVNHFSERINVAELKIVEDYQKNLELNCDVDMMEHAFGNIIENSIKYSHPGGTIKIKAWEEEVAIKIAISDTGVGIHQEDIPYIFDRFYRSKQGNTIKNKGAGLGLALAKWIIDSHEGSISVKSSVGTGSEFLIILPKNPH